jgi:hypothetical protein
MWSKGFAVRGEQVTKPAGKSRQEGWEGRRRRKSVGGSGPFAAVGSWHNSIVVICM